MTKSIKTNLYEQFLNYFDAQIQNSIESEYLQKIRKDAAEEFALHGFPSKANEDWRKTDLSKVLALDYKIQKSDAQRLGNQRSTFECTIDAFETDEYTVYNGICMDNSPKSEYPKGVIICPISEAQDKYPEIFNKRFGQIAPQKDNGIVALNTANFTDGYFIYIPDNIEVKQTLQIVNLIESQENIFSNSRFLIVLGNNAKLNMVLCDDSLSELPSIVNTVTEIYVGEGAKMDLYKLQNKDQKSTVISNVFVHQERNSTSRNIQLTLNGGIVRNRVDVHLLGQGAHADVLGLYLVDGHQLVDNHVFVNHAVSDCTSNQLFKGIADEFSRAVFNGHILVAKDAQRTAAFQNNNNIQLTDTAGIDTHPFLEIYADDVKCSHGATVGQLDMDALFYMRQRGICERNAQMLLMYSFTQEVVNQIHLPALKESIEDLVTKRLKGELSACENCALSCADPDAAITFDIDVSKI